MSSPVSLSDVREAKARAGQMSQANGFGGRRLRVVPVVDKDSAVAFWADLMRRKYRGDAVAISRDFSVTEQTGRNWLAGVSCPLFHHVDLAMVIWPEAFAARYGAGAELRAVA